jgi:predicted nuclease with TOPRIM domain
MADEPRPLKAPLPADVEKLAKELREYAIQHFLPSYRAWFNEIAAALEAVARERDEARRFSDAWMHTNDETQAQLEAAQKERDELRHELDQLDRVSAITMHCSTESGMAKKLEALLRGAGR